VTFDARQGLVTAAEPRGGRGNLLGLAIVVGLFGFFLADAVPGGLNAVATFFIAAGAVLLVFLLAVVVALIVRRLRQAAASPPVPIAAPARRRPHRLATAGAAAQAGAAEAEDVIRPALPGSRRYFLRVVDELLTAVDALPEHQGREIEADVLSFATSADPLDLVDLIERRRGVPEIQRFVLLAEQLTGPQLRYLSVVLKARKVLR
jgi:hypothetical protein